MPVRSVRWVSHTPSTSNANSFVHHSPRALEILACMYHGSWPTVVNFKVFNDSWHQPACEGTRKNSMPHGRHCQTTLVPDNDACHGRKKVSKNQKQKQTDDLYRRPLSQRKKKRKQRGFAESLPRVPDTVDVEHGSNLRFKPWNHPSPVSSAVTSSARTDSQAPTSSSSARTSRICSTVCRWNASWSTTPLSIPPGASNKEESSASNLELVVPCGHGHFVRNWASRDTECRWASKSPSRLRSNFW